jgi:hypothetical protein
VKYISIKNILMHIKFLTKIEAHRKDCKEIGTAFIW